MSIVLDSTSEKLQLTTDGTESIDVVATYADKTTSGLTPGSKESAITTATTTDIVDAPAASTQRIISHVCCTNKSGTSAVLTPMKDVSATDYEMGDYTVNGGESLVYAEGIWAVKNVAAKRPFFRAYRATSAQSISTDVWTKVALNGESFDPEGWFDSATNYRFTPLVEGYYLITGQAYLYYLNDTDLGYVSIYKNGSAVATSLKQASDSSTDVVPIVSDLVYLNGTSDYVELWAFHVEGSTESIRHGAEWTFFSGVKVAD